METPSYSTASTILTQVRAKTRISSNPNATALQNTAMLQQLHDVNSWAHNYPYTVGMLGWKFNDREAIIQAKTNTTLNGAVSSGATSVVLTSGTNFDSPPIASDFPSLGGFYIRTGTYIYDFGIYESKSSNTLSTVSGLQIDHATAEPVHKIYALPSNFGKTRALFRQSNIVEYYYLDQDIRQVPPYGYYMLKSFTSTNAYSGTFLILPESIGSINFKLNYMIKPNTISNSDLSDKINMPDGSGRQAVIEKMCQYVWGILGETDLEETSRIKAEEAIDHCLGEWAMATAQTNQSLALMF